MNSTSLYPKQFMLFPNLIFIGLAYAQQPITCPDKTPTKRAYFGDTHIHTHFSLDANLQGTKTGPKEAYVFAKGLAKFLGEIAVRVDLLLGIHTKSFPDLRLSTHRKSPPAIR